MLSTSLRADTHSLVLGGTLCLADQASPSQVQAADELRAYLTRMAGRPFTVVRERDLSEADAAVIFLGPTRAAEAAGIALADPGDEEYRIVVRAGHLYIVGGAVRGTLYGAFVLLEEVLGVRWWTHWGEETVPVTVGPIDAGLDIHREPAWRYRDYADGVEWGSPEKPFFARNRVNGRYGFLGERYGGSLRWGGDAHTHTMQFLVPETLFATHPEYFALQPAGHRSPINPCVTLPAVRSKIEAKLREWIEADRRQMAEPAHPFQEVPSLYYAIAYNDHDTYCHCGPCQTLIDQEGSYAGPILDLVNDMARRLRVDYPRVRLETLAYQWTQRPPKHMKAEQNVTIRLCTVQNNFAQPLAGTDNQAFMDDLKGWLAVADDVIVWDYGLNYTSNSGPNGLVDALIDHVAELRGVGVSGFFYEHEQLFPQTDFSTDLWELKTWVAAKLMEDPARDGQALVRAFCEGYYGPAAPALLDYLAMRSEARARTQDYQSLQASVAAMSHLDLGFMVRAHTLLDAAAASVADESILAHRLANARFSLDRATLSLHARLMEEHRRQGGGSGDLPIDIAAAFARCEALLAAMPTGRFPLNQALAEVERTRLAVIAQAEPAYAPLPRELQRRNPRIIYPGEFRLAGLMDLAIAEAHGGVLAAVIDPHHPALTDGDTIAPTATVALTGGVFDFNIRQESNPFVITPEQIGEPGAWRWVRVMTEPLKATQTLFLPANWQCQIDLGGQLPSDGQRRRTSVWLELKREAANESGRHERVWVGRAALVVHQ